MPTRKKKGKEAEVPQIARESTISSIGGNMAEPIPTDGDDIRKWLNGESTLLKWLEEDPEQLPTFYTGTEGASRGPSSEIGLEALERRKKELDKREGEIAEKERLYATLADPVSDHNNEDERTPIEIDTSYRSRERDLLARIERLESELKQKSEETKLRDEELSSLRNDQQGALVIGKAGGNVLELTRTIDELKQSLHDRDEELKGIKEILSYKEDELSRREEDIQYRERKITEERTRFEDTKKSTSGIEEANLKKHLEALKAEIDKKELELRSKEEYINIKEADLKKREQGLIEDDLKKKDEELRIEAELSKTKTGNPRLDDLLLGGIPFGSNVLVYGPPFVGKETMVNQFIAEGLKKGVPAIWVTTDKTPADLREEMKSVLPAYEEYEALGLVRYIDSYSRSMGDTNVDKYAIYIDEPTAHDQIMDAVEEAAKKFKEKNEYYRLAFRTISTLIAYSDPNTAFRFLNPFCGRRKRDKAVSMFTIEKGMHGEQEIQMLGSIMDGMIDFKIDQLRTFFMVRGITDVQSRSYIRYTATRHGLTIGSFSLDHIK